MSYNTRTLGKRIAALSLVIGLLAGTFLPSPGVLYAETPDSSSVVDAGEPSFIGADETLSDATDVLSSVTSALSESTSSAAQSASSSDSTESASSESVSASSVSEPASDSASVPESNAEDSSVSEGSEPADSDSAVSSSMSASVSESASAVQSESVSAADSVSTENDTVDEADEPFNALAVLDPKPGHDIKAKVGDEITLTSGVNRDDVVVSYQWQRMQLSMPKKETVQEEIVPLFDYDEASPTWYSYPLTDMTEYELAERSGLPQSTISSWYHKDMVPSVPSLEKICAAFGITLSQLFAEENTAVCLTDSQKQLLERWSRLTEKQQRALFDLMDVM